MIRRLALLILFVLVPASAEAQSRGAYFELFGNGGLYSVNYERELGNNARGRIGAGAWVTHGFFTDNEVRIISVPMTVTWLAGGERHFFEGGGGILVGHSDEKISGESGAFASLTSVIGYRYQRPQGFLFRAGLTPFVPLSGGDAAYPDEDPMISVGFSFGRTW